MSTTKYPERDRAIFQVLRACRGKSATEAVAGTPVSAQTLQNWRKGRTRYPRHITLAAIARAHGLRWVLVEDHGTDGKSVEAAERAERAT